MAPSPTIFVTGATGQLGGLVVDALLGGVASAAVPAGAIVAGVRDPDGAAAAALRARGVAVRVAEYSRPDTLDAAFTGVDRLLLVSGGELGAARRAQHRNVVDAAKRAGVGLIAYTSILHADTSPLFLAEDHRDTEAALAASGVPAVLLRNGWYTEVFAWRLPSALQRGVLEGAAGDGRYSAAARADYAAAAAAVLTSGDHAGRVYELAGDAGFTLAELAAVASEAAGRTIAYRDLSPERFRAEAASGGVPEAMARLLADIDAGAAKGALFDDGGALSRLIGRPTTPFRTTIAAFVRGSGAV